MCKKIKITIISFMLVGQLNAAANAAWLADWGQRVKITVSQDNIDSDLTHFPLPIFLGASVGSNSADMRSVFDELGSDANRKKIAVTTDDGTTQVYVEIEHWDDAGEEAVLWVSRSDMIIASAAATVLYLYYDNNKADNTAFVGDTDDEVAENVWDSHFKLVQHLADATPSSTKDSTLNDLDGTKSGANNPQEAVGTIANGQDFSSDNINHGNLGIGNTYTAECWIKADTLVGAGDLGLYGFSIMASSLNAGSQYPLWLTVHTTEVRFWAYEATASGGHRVTVGANLNTADRFHIAATAIKSGNSKVFVNAVEKLSFTNDGQNNWSSIFTLGDLRPGRLICFDGIIDEVRISDSVREDAWIKACYYAQDDNLISFDAPETKPQTAIVLNGVTMKGVTIK